MTIAHPATIGMKASNLDQWLPRQADDAAVLKLRAQLIAEKTRDVLALLPAGESAVRELGQLLAARDGLTIPDDAMGILETLGRTYTHDICVLTKAEDAPYLLTAAVLCFPNRWRLADKAGKPLLAVHAPVPDYADTLSAQVDFFLERLRPGRCFTRSNWGLASVDTLHLPDPVPPVNPATDTDFYVRIEDQAFVKLPGTGAVIFTIQTTVTPWRDVAAEDRAGVLEQTKRLSAEWLNYKSMKI